MKSPRLRAVAALVPPCERIIDVGTDHAYLPIYLLRQGRCRAAVAADKRPGPLRRARKNIEEARLTDKIQLALADGLDHIDFNRSDIIVIAGLGGLEISDILARAGRDFRACVLQPMKSLPELRSWLGQNKLAITDESIACERGRFYTVLSARPVDSPVIYSGLQTWAGPCLLAKKPAGYRAYLERTLIQLEKRSRGDALLPQTAEQLRALLAQMEQEI